MIKNFNERINLIKENFGSEELVFDDKDSCRKYIKNLIDHYWSFIKYVSNNSKIIDHHYDTKLVLNFNDASYLFRDWPYTTIFELDTSKVTNMLCMFSASANLKQIGNINTDKVTDMNSMFGGCSSLENIPEMNTSNVTNMTGMFDLCSSIKTIPLLNTSKVTSMDRMFEYCDHLESIPELDTSNVITMEGMFTECWRLKSIPKFNISKVKNIKFMFGSCSYLERMGFNTSDPQSILDQLPIVDGISKKK